MRISQCSLSDEIRYQAQNKGIKEESFLFHFEAHFIPIRLSYHPTQTNFHLWSMKYIFFILRWCLRLGGPLGTLFRKRGVRK